MADTSRRDLLQTFVDRANAGDWAAIETLVQPDYEEVYSQSGERIHGGVNARAIIENYPGGSLERTAERVVGADDQWVMTPASTILRIEGTGDVWTVVQKVRYPDGTDWHVVQIIEFRDDKVAKVQSSFAADFEAPEWRAKWVDRVTG